MFSIIDAEVCQSLFDQESAASTVGHLKAAAWEKARLARENKDFTDAKHWERFAAALHRAELLAEKLEL